MSTVLLLSGPPPDFRELESPPLRHRQFNGIENVNADQGCLVQRTMSPRRSIQQQSVTRWSVLECVTMSVLHKLYLNTRVEEAERKEKLLVDGGVRCHTQLVVVQLVVRALQVGLR